MSDPDAKTKRERAAPEAARWPAEFPRLRTQRLVLRPPTMADAADVLAIRSDPVVRAGYAVEPYVGLDEAQKHVRALLDGFDAGESLAWMLVPAGTQHVVGSCTLWNLDLPSGCGELGYELHRDAWGQGLASEAAAEVVRFGFQEMGLHRIEANPLAHNPASHLLLERLGFTLEGTLRERVLFEGRYIDQLWYGLLRGDWERSSR